MDIINNKFISICKSNNKKQIKEYFFKNIDNGIFLSYNNYQAIREIIENKNIEIILMLINTINKRETLLNASLFSNLYFNIKTLLSKDNLLDKYTLFYLILEKNDIELVEQIWMHIDLESNIPEQKRLFRHLCEWGYSDLIKWFYLSYKIKLDNLGIYTIISLLKINKLDIVKWLINKENIDISNEINNIFQIGCDNKNLEIIKWIKNDYDKYLNINYDNVSNICCHNGGLNILQYLYQPIYTINIRFLKLACINGYLDIAKWIYSKNKYFYYDEEIFFIFIEVCEKGRLEIAKWLVDKFKINTTKYNNLALTQAHYFNKYNILEWLIEKNNLDMKLLINFEILDCYY